jgi:peroxiredoxin
MKSIKTFVVGAICSLVSMIAAQAQQAPDFTVIDISGTEHQLYHDYLDEGHVVVMGFFYVGAPLAVDIFSELEVYSAVQEANSIPVDFLLMSNLDTEAALNQFVSQSGIQFPLVGNEGGANAAMGPYMTGEFGVFYGYPMMVIVGPDGTVIYDPWGETVEETIAYIDYSINFLLNGGLVNLDEEQAIPPSVVLTSQGLEVTMPLNVSNGVLNLFHSDGRLYYEGQLNEGRNVIQHHESGVSIYSVQSKGRHFTGKFSY